MRVLGKGAEKAGECHVSVMESGLLGGLHVYGLGWWR